MENRNAHSLQRQNELEQQLMSRSAPNDAVLPEPRPPPAKPRTDLDALFALTKRFCCVQIGNCFILLIAVPASIYCMILSMGILIGFLGSIKFVEVQCSNKSEREKRDVFGRHWLLLMHLWLPYAAICTLRVASDEEPVQRGVKRSRDLPDGLCYVVLDDDKITRLLARKQIAKFGPHPSSIVLGESRLEALSVPERVNVLAQELGEENIIVILDQNLNYPDGDVLGTDLASTLRRNQYGGPIVIQSANAEPSDCITYADAGADGTLAKGVLAATSASELALIFWGRLAKGRKRSRT